MPVALKLLKFDDSPVVFREDLDRMLSGEESLVFQEVMRGYYFERRGGRRLVESTVRSEILVLQRFFAFCRKPPWKITEDDFNTWCYQIGEVEKCAMTTQRRYQTTIQEFFRYLTKRYRKRDLIERQFGVRVRQIVHDDNKVPHRLEDESTRERKAIPHEEIELAFDELRREIAEARRFGSKDYRPLQRDLAMFYLTYGCGLRADEAIGVNITSFAPCGKAPEFGVYGSVTVFGKGFRGSDKKRREILIGNPFLVEILDWYVKNIRPHFLVKAQDGETAFFLSERGKRIRYSTFLARFHHLMEIAGLEEFEYTPHCLRHSSVTHKIMVRSPESVRTEHGHEGLSTTQRYSQIPNRYLQMEHRQAVNHGLRLWKESQTQT